MGVEIDYQHWFENKIEAYLSEHEFDFVIGAVHYVDGMTVMASEYTATRDVVTAYRHYYEEVEKSVRSGLFNVLAQSSPTLAGVFRYTSVILIVIALIISRLAFFGLD